MKNQVRAYFAEAKWLHEEHVPTFESHILHTLCDLMSSMSLAMKFEDDIILGLLVTQSKASFVAISPIPTKDVVASMQYPELTSATRMYSSNVGTCSSCNHLASAK